MEIKLQKAVLHILDTLSTLPVYSQREIDLTEESVREFILSHVQKLYFDEANKNGTFKEHSQVKKDLEQLENNKDLFIEVSCSLADRLYGIMAKNAEIPIGDLLISLISLDNIDYVAMIKFNYKTGYTHYIDYSGEETSNRIITNYAVLPTTSQRNEEGALIELNAKKLKIIEKKFPINGEKCNYFSDLFLECETELSRKESLKIMKKIAEDISKENQQDSFENVAALKVALFENVEEKGQIDVEDVAVSSFSDKPRLQQEYIDRVKTAGVKPNIYLEEEGAERKFSKHKIKTDNGIEISIPMSIYRNRDSIEFINNPDGTSSIILKNINQIVSK